MINRKHLIFLMLFVTMGSAVQAQLKVRRQDDKAPPTYDYVITFLQSGVVMDEATAKGAREIMYWCEAMGGNMRGGDLYEAKGSTRVNVNYCRFYSLKIVSGNPWPRQPPAIVREKAAVLCTKEMRNYRGDCYPLN